MRSRLSLLLFGLAAITAPVLWSTLPWAPWLATLMGLEPGYTFGWRRLPFAYASVALGMACVWWGLLRLLVRPDMTVGTAIVLVGATSVIAGFGLFAFADPIWHLCYALLGAERTAALYPHYGVAWWTMPAIRLTFILGPLATCVGTLIVAFECRWRAA